MSLIETLDLDLKNAMKSRNAEKTSTLRLVKAALTNYMIEKKKDRLSDEEVLDILQKQVKQRRESVESYLQGGRSELADKEKTEIALLEQYLPKPLTDDEIKALAKQAVDSCQAKSKNDAGKVMQVIMPKVRGRADGKRVNQIVLEMLA
ncbi:MAG TPA: GatB/YqeY domain-containing protein [bacterium]|nr:GatB/YqeY domain-containing protein [bacterium]